MPDNANRLTVHGTMTPHPGQSDAYRVDIDLTPLAEAIAKALAQALAIARRDRALDLAVR